MQPHAVPGGKHSAGGFLRWRIDFLNIALCLSPFPALAVDARSAALTYPYCVSVISIFDSCCKTSIATIVAEKGCTRSTRNAKRPFLFLLPLSTLILSRSARFVVAVYSTIPRHASPTAMLLRSRRKRGMLA